MSPTLPAAASAKSLQSCPTLCDPVDGSPPGSPIPGILQARTLEWVAISFSNAWKWKVKVKSLSRVPRPFWTLFPILPNMLILHHLVSHPTEEVIVSWNTYFIPFCLSSSPWIPILHRSTHFVLSCRSCILLSFFFNLSLCLVFSLSDFHYSICQTTYFFFCIFSFAIYWLRLGFISANAFSNWLLFTVSSSLWQRSVFLSIAFLNSFSIFIMSFFELGIYCAGEVRFILHSYRKFPFFF